MPVRWGAKRKDNQGNNLSPMEAGRKEREKRAFFEQKNKENGEVLLAKLLKQKVLVLKCQTSTDPKEADHLRRQFERDVRCIKDAIKATKGHRFHWEPAGPLKDATQFMVAVA